MATRTDPAAPNALAASSFPQFRQRLGMYLCAEVEDLVGTRPAKSFLVENLIQPCSINLLVGDSGIGKSALGYQLGLAVAAGAPFLGFPVRQGKVLFVDYENAIWDFHRILEQQRKHLGLAAYPAKFLLWPLHPSHRDGQLQEAILELCPQLVILDSLRSFAPALERTTSRAAGELRKLRQLIRLLPRRCWDDHGEPLGYERSLPDPSLLQNEDQRAAYHRLPDSFRFREGPGPESGPWRIPQEPVSYRSPLRKPWLKRPFCRLWTACVQFMRPVQVERAHFCRKSAVNPLLSCA